MGIYRPPAPSPSAEPQDGDDLAAALDAIDAATPEAGGSACLLRFLARNALVSAAKVNRGARTLAPLQEALSACIASGVYEEMWGLSADDVAALIDAD